MPVPPEYERASTQFYDFLESARDEADLQTTHQAYTMTEGVLRAFRRRLAIDEAVAFANALPLLLRALFVSDWDVREPPAPFADVEAMTREVQALRAGHNFAPPDAIACVARALRRHVHAEAFDAVLARLRPGAREFWRAPPKAQ